MTTSWTPISEGCDENRWENAQSHYMITSSSFRGNLQLGPVLPGGNNCQFVTSPKPAAIPTIKSFCGIKADGSLSKILMLFGKKKELRIHLFMHRYSVCDMGQVISALKWIWSGSFMQHLLSACFVPGARMEAWFLLLGKFTILVILRDPSHLCLRGHWEFCSCLYA